MVRRVWALEGDELECDDPEEEEGAYHVPKVRWPLTAKAAHCFLGGFRVES